jgi:hypothetical protein
MWLKLLELLRRSNLKKPVEKIDKKFGSKAQQS